MEPMFTLRMSMHFATHVYVVMWIIIECLVTNGANIHVNDDNALYWACYNDNLDVVKILIKLGADVHAKNDRAFRVAHDYDHKNIVKYLEQIMNNE